MDSQALALLGLLTAEEAMSMPRAAKRLGWSMSQLQRVLTVLGEEASFGGLGLIAAVHDGERVLLRLTDKGRALCRGG